MSDTGPPIKPWSQVRAERAAIAGEPPRRPQDYASYRDYFDDVIAPTLRSCAIDVQLGYAELKRRG